VFFKVYGPFCYYILLMALYTFLAQITSAGKAILVTGCESPLAWYLCKKLDDLGFAVFAGFKDVADNADAELLKEECSARVKIVQIDPNSEAQVE
jgi:3-hydroxybutyrate dehydrogenase